MQENDVTAAGNTALRDRLVLYLQDAYAMENEIVHVLEGQVKDAAPYPAISAQLQQHLDETKVHRERVAERLSAYGKTPPAIKGAVSALMGSVTGAIAGARKDSLARSARDDYATEHLEIATYAMLIAAARAYGDAETVRICQLNLRDEVKMARWLEEHIAQATVLAYEQAGITLPVEVQQEAISTWLAAWQGAQWDAQKVVAPGQQVNATITQSEVPAVSAPDVPPDVAPLVPPNEPSNPSGARV
jgi:ferritin-like metal-binding protein YciE